MVFSDPELVKFSRGSRGNFNSAVTKSAIQIRQAEFEESDPTPESQLLELFELDFEFWDDENNYVFVDQNTEPSL